MAAWLLACEQGYEEVAAEEESRAIETKAPKTCGTSCGAWTTVEADFGSYGLGRFTKLNTISVDRVPQDVGPGSHGLAPEVAYSKLTLSRPSSKDDEAVWTWRAAILANGNARQTGSLRFLDASGYEVGRIDVRDAWPFSVSEQIGPDGGTIEVELASEGYVATVPAAPSNRDKARVELVDSGVVFGTYEVIDGLASKTSYQVGQLGGMYPTASTGTKVRLVRPAGPTTRAVWDWAVSGEARTFDANILFKGGHTWTLTYATPTKLELSVDANGQFVETLELSVYSMTRS